MSITVMVALLRSGNWNGITNQDYLVHIQLVQDFVQSGAIGMILKDYKNAQMVFVRQNFGRKSLGLFSNTTLKFLKLTADSLSLNSIQLA